MIISRKTLYSILLIVLCATTLIRAQNDRSNTALTVTDVQTVTDNPPFPLVETYLAVNPADSDNILASAMSTSTDSSIVYATWNGGRTWQKVQNGNNGVFSGGDPMLTFDGNGRAYFTTITPRISIWRSSDGGHTWSDSIKIGQSGEAHDRQWIAASANSNGKTTAVYGTAKTVTEEGRHVLITTRSVNGAKNFSNPRVISPKNQNIHAPSDLVVRNNGTVLLPYLVYHGYKSRDKGIARGEHLIFISDDNGETWKGPHHIGNKLVYGNTVDDKSLVSKGLDASALAVDETGGKFNGSIYTAWTTIMDGHLQVVAAFSRDGGRTWSDPVRVNDGGFDSNHSSTMTAVNDNGVIAVTWNDRRNNTDDDCFQHYIAISRDGGQSFSANKQISNQQTCPGSGRFINGGETQGLVALPDGSFRVTWPVGKKDSLTMSTAVINVAQNTQ